MDLTVKIPVRGKELVLKNPIMPAAGTFGNAVEYKNLLELGRLGAIVPASVCYEAGSPPPAKRCFRTEHGIVSSFGPSVIGYKTVIETVMPELECYDTPIFINLKVRNMDEMDEMIYAFSDFKQVAGIELNLNCPYGKAGSEHYWRNDELLETLVRRARAAVGDKLLIVKSPTSEYLMCTLVPVIEKAGADAFTSFNGITGFAIDIETRKFRCGMSGGGGYSGPGIKPFALMCAHESAKAGKLPVIGGGGIVCAADVLEYIMAGAYAVQIGSANLMRPDFMPRLLDELQELMSSMNISSIEEIRGVAEY